MTDPIFCNCGAPAAVFGAKDRRGGFVKCPHGSGKCKFFTGVPHDQQVSDQNSRVLAWLSDAGSQRATVGPGVDFRCFVDRDQTAKLALRPLSPSPVLLKFLRDAGAEMRMLRFSNYIQFASTADADAGPASPTSASGRASGRAPAPVAASATDSKPLTQFFVFPTSRYDELLALVTDKAMVARPRQYRLPPCVMDALAYRERLDSMASVELPRGGMYGDLHPYQREGVAAGIKRGGRIMIADEMGLGKTIQALGIAYHYREQGVLVITCPSSLVSNWRREIIKWWKMSAERICMVRSKKAADVSVAAAVVIASYNCLDALRDVVPSINTVIVDESHSIKNETSARTKAVLALCEAAQHVILLTGTPTLARPMELYTQLRALTCSGSSSLRLPSRHAFAERYCNRMLSCVGKINPKMVPVESGFNRLDELTVILRALMIRRKKAEVLSQLPAKTRELLTLSITDEERNKYKRALKRMGNGGGGGGGGLGGFDANNASGSVSLDMYRQTAEAKIPAVTDYVKNLVESFQGEELGDADDGGVRNKVLLFAHHQSMMGAIKAAIDAANPPIDYIYIDGQVPPAARDDLAQHFQNAPSCRLAVLSITACGTGMNFTAANMVIFCELHWTPSTLLQCEDRAHRMGQRNACTVRYLLGEETTDEPLWEMLESKLEVNTAVVADELLDTGGTGAVLVDRNDAQRVDRAGQAGQMPKTAPVGELPSSMRAPGAAAPKAVHQSKLDGWVRADGVATVSLADIVTRDNARFAGEGALKQPAATEDEDDDVVVVDSVPKLAPAANDDVVQIVQSHAAATACKSDTVVFAATAPTGPPTLQQQAVVQQPAARSASVTSLDCGGVDGSGAQQPPPGCMMPGAGGVPAPPPRRTVFRGARAATPAVVAAPTSQPAASPTSVVTPPQVLAPAPQTPASATASPRLGLAVPNTVSAQVGEKRDRGPVAVTGPPLPAIPPRTRFVPRPRPAGPPLATDPAGTA